MLLALLVALLTAWQLASVVLLLFGAVLFAILLDSLTIFVGRGTRLPRSLSLATVLIGLAALIVVIGWITGPRLGDQLYDLASRVPSAFEEVTERLKDRPWGRALIQDIPPPAELVKLASLGQLSGVFSTTLGVFSNALIILVLGTYLAVAPQRYINGIIRLLPPRRRQYGREVLAALGHALRWWLLGRVASMTVVGLLTALGLSLIGMPLILALALIAGLLSFVPYIGPIAAAIPAIIIGLAESPYTALYVVAVYAVVQALESNVITPLIQERAVSLPPATLLTGQIVMAVLFGLAGLLLATPMVVACIMLVQMLYIRTVLEEDISVLGQHGRD